MMNFSAHESEPAQPRLALCTDMLPSQQELAAMRLKNNPNGYSVGPFTGRCQHCASKDLWREKTRHGCNCCGANLNSRPLPQVS